MTSDVMFVLTVSTVHW